MGIFSGLSTPKYLTPEESWAGAREQAALVSRNFMEGVNQAQNQESIDQRQQQIDMQKQQVAAAITKRIDDAAKLNVVAGRLKDASTPAAVWDLVSQNPVWMLDPATSKATEGYLKSADAAAKIQSSSINAKISTQQSTDFTKNLDALNNADPAAVAAIRAAKPNPDGSPSAQQWQMLGDASTRIKNAAKQAQADAIINAGPGNEVIKTIDEKGGEKVTIRPQPTSATRNKFQFHDVGGQGLIFDPESGTVKMLNSQGDTVKATPGQFLKMQSDMKGEPNVDPGLKAYVDSQVNKAIGYKPVSPLPKSQDQLKKGQKYQTSRGVATWDGTNFVQ